MTTDTAVEELLARSVESMTLDPDPDAVLQAIDARRERHRSDAARRRRTRRTIAGAGAAAAALTIVAMVAVGNRDDLSSIDAAGPSTSATAPTITSPARESSELPQTVQPPGSGDTVTTLGGDSTGFWVARGTPATVSRVERDGTLGPSTQLQGIALVAAADPAFLWLLVEEPGPDARPYRLKQIDRADGALVASHVVELGGAPIGLDVQGDSILARWRTGAIELDRTGVQRSSTPRWSVEVRQQLTTGELSWSLAEAIDGASLLRSSDPTGATASATLDGARRLFAAPALGSEIVVIERVLEDRIEIESRRAADDPAPNLVATLDIGESLAWVTPEEVWVIAGPKLERRQR